VRVNVSQVFENVGAGDVQGSAAAQEAAKLAMSQATRNLIAPHQVGIVSIEAMSRRRFLLGPNQPYFPSQSDVKQLKWMAQSQAKGHRQLGTVYTKITFSMLATMENLGLNNTSAETFLTWLRRDISGAVKDESFTWFIKIAGEAAGINIFNFAKVLEEPTYSEPAVVYVATFAPTTSPTLRPIAKPPPSTYFTFEHVLFQQQ
jgi:hypothetical protein